MFPPLLTVFEDYFIDLDFLHLTILSFHLHILECPDVYQHIDYRSLIYQYTMRVSILPATALAATFAGLALAAPSPQAAGQTVPVQWADVEAGAYAAASSAAAAANHKRHIHEHAAREPQKQATDPYGDPSVWGELANDAKKDYCATHPSDAMCKTAKRAQGDCEGAGSNCIGAVTHYDGGTGSCGKWVDTNVDYVVSLPDAMMEAVSPPNPNNNPYCGRTITIVAPNGNTATATVEDTCVGCAGYDIDLTDALFSYIAGCDGK